MPERGEASGSRAPLVHVVGQGNSEMLAQHQAVINGTVYLVTAWKLKANSGVAVMVRGAAPTPACRML